MCTWSSADRHQSNRTEHQKTALVMNPRTGQTRKRRIRRHDYIWDLDDGYPGFIRQTKRNKLNLFIDSDRNGSFTRDDELIGSARIRTPYRRRRQGRLLDSDQTGSIRALNAEPESDSSSTHVVLDPSVDLELHHPDGSVVALYKGLQV